MVSRGGRSKGCSHCRRRRIKCDETRPTCNRCKKRGLDCDGPKESTWINETNSFPSPPAETQIIKASLPPAMSFAAFEDDFCMAYTRKTLLRGGPVELAYDMVSVPNTVPDPGLDLLREAVLSLAITFFGTQHREKQVTARGYSHYGSVLRQLNSHLTHSHLQTSDETLLTALTCMLLEIFLPTGPDNFLKHARGIEAMLNIRGPPQQLTRNTAVIFQGLRLLSIVSGLADSRPSVYSREEWKRIPSCHVDEAGLIRHQVFTILAECTRFMSERDRLIASPRSSEAHQSLLSQIKQARKELESIYPLWQEYNAKQFDRPTSELGKKIDIANHHSATAFMLYHTALICILELLDSLEPLPEYALLRNASALEIVQSMDWKGYEKREGTGESNTIGFVATKVAWQSLGGLSSPEGRRLAKAVKSVVNGVFAVGAWDYVTNNRPFLGEDLAKNAWQSWKMPLKNFEPRLTAPQDLPAGPTHPFFSDKTTEHIQDVFIYSMGRGEVPRVGPGNTA